MMAKGHPCHGGTVNGGCGFVGIPYFSRPFTLFHLMVYETVRATWKKYSYG